MTYRVAHRRPVSGSSQATEPAVRGQRFPQFVVYAIGGPDHLPSAGPLRRTLGALGDRHAEDLSVLHETTKDSAAPRLPRMWPRVPRQRVGRN